MASEIQVYGMHWCGRTFGVREYLMNARVSYDYYDVEQDPEASDLANAITEGRRRFPVVVVHERVLTNPSRVELQDVLHEYKIRPEHSSHGGPIVPDPALWPRRR